MGGGEDGKVRGGSERVGGWESGRVGGWEGGDGRERGSGQEVEK